MTGTVVILTPTECWVHENLVGVGVITKAGLGFLVTGLTGTSEQWSGSFLVFSEFSVENPVDEAPRKLRARKMGGLHFRRGQKICG